jgi:TusA-related sulfurtransferase
MDKNQTLDCYGLLCPIPIIKIVEAIKGLPPGQVLEVIATDEGIVSDLPAWCRRTGHEFLGIEKREGEYYGYVRKVGP